MKNKWLCYFFLAGSLGWGMPCHAVPYDFTLFAQQQTQRIDQVIAPYRPEIQQLQAQVVKQQLRKASPTDQYSSKSVMSSTEKPAYTPLLVFVSFSMPKTSLEQWIMQTRLAGGSVVIRGLVQNSFKKTAEILTPLLEKEPTGILVDPTLFEKYQIQQVPAVVIQTASEFDVLYGDVSLTYALEQLSKTQTPQTPIAEKALQKLKGKPNV